MAVFPTLTSVCKYRFLSLCRTRGTRGHPIYSLETPVGNSAATKTFMKKQLAIAGTSTKFKPIWIDLWVLITMWNVKFRFVLSRLQNMLHVRVIIQSQLIRIILLSCTLITFAGYEYAHILLCTCYLDWLLCVTSPLLTKLRTNKLELPTTY